MSKNRFVWLFSEDHWIGRQFNKSKGLGELMLLVASTQVGIQITGFLSGLLVINMLSLKEYAYYTIANSILGTMTVLADSGISKGVISLGGRDHENTKKMGEILATGISLRRTFAIVVAVAIVPVLIYLLWQNGAAWVTILGITIAILAVFILTLTTTIIKIPILLWQRVKLLQKIDFRGNLIRLAILSISIPIWKYAYVAIGAAATGQFYINRQISIDLKKEIPGVQVVKSEHKKHIVEVVKKIMPTSIYYSVSSQITIFLISAFGSTSNVAEIGALGRLAVMLSALNIVFETVIAPRFAKHKTGITSFFWKSQLLMIVLSVIIVFAVYLSSKYILMLLGSSYSGLDYELVLVMISGCIGFLSGTTNNLMASRAMIIPPVLFLGVAITTQVITIAAFKLDDLESFILYGMSNLFVLYILRLVYFTIITKNVRQN